MEACSSFISYSSSKLSLAIPEGWTPQTPLDWIQEKASWYLHIELVLLHSISVDKICEDRDLPQQLSIRVPTCFLLNPIKRGLRSPTLKDSKTRLA